MVFAVPAQTNHKPSVGTRFRSCASGLYLHGSIFPFSAAIAGWNLSFQAKCATSKLKQRVMMLSAKSHSPKRVVI